ncbi:hypothetical protein [Brachybacterium phenoliresistens]|uniref:hypothetical protein n=1 Tax=Brachybacterium phenoliresistens TaxID=396014 RepID=UPI0031DCD980
MDLGPMDERALLAREIRSRAAVGHDQHRIARELRSSIADVRAALGTTHDTPDGMPGAAGPLDGAPARARHLPVGAEALPVPTQREIRERFEAEQTVERISRDLQVSAAQVYATLGIPLSGGIPAERIDWIILFPEGEEPQLRLTRGEDGSPTSGRRVGPTG